MHLIDGFFGRKERRWFEKTDVGMRHGKFAAHAVSGASVLRVLGTTVSKEGVVFVSPAEIPEPELQFTFTLRERAIPSRVRVDREEAMQAPERIVHRYYCSFSAIAADDWDAVVRYVDGVPEPKPAERPVVVDDDFRSLPAVVQDQIVRRLVAMRRLVAPPPGTAPLIRLKAGSVRELAPGRRAFDVLVHSRFVGDETRAYDTRFRVHSDRRIELLTSP
jgi:hypothetical protein